jgi:hypothetical protein
MRFAAFIDVPFPAPRRIFSAMPCWRTRKQRIGQRPNPSHDTPLRGRATERFQNDTWLPISIKTTQLLEKKHLEWLPQGIEEKTYAEGNEADRSFECLDGDAGQGARRFNETLKR